MATNNAMVYYEDGNNTELDSYCNAAFDIVNVDVHRTGGGGFGLNPRLGAAASRCQQKGKKVFVSLAFIAEQRGYTGLFSDPAEARAVAESVYRAFGFPKLASDPKFVADGLNIVLSGRGASNSTIMQHSSLLAFLEKVRALFWSGTPEEFYILVSIPCNSPKLLLVRLSTTSIF